MAKINPNLKYIFFDLDGTLLTSKKTVTTQTVTTISNLKKAGFKVGIATGQHPKMFGHIVNLIKPDLPLIGVNGNFVYNPKTNQNHFFKELPRPVVNKVLTFFIDYNFSFFIYTDDAILYHDPGNHPRVKDTFARFKNFPLKLQPNMVKVNEISGLTGFAILKMLVFTAGISEQIINKLKAEINSQPGIYWVASDESLLDVMPTGVDKSKGLLFLSDQKIIDLERTIVFGDGYNDIEMFKIANTSVAVGGDKKSLNEVATFITTNSDHEGISTFVRKYF